MKPPAPQTKALLIRFDSLYAMSLLSAPPSSHPGLCRGADGGARSAYLPFVLAVRYSSGVSISIVVRPSKCFLFQMMMASTS